MPQFIDDLEAVVNAIGVDKPGIAFDLAEIPWDSAEQRDGFLQQLTQSMGAQNG
jgi:hypothetical protein